jgi:hypothetical protein
MSRVAWLFNGYAWPVNPEKDSGWTKDDVVGEVNPLQSNISTFQFTGRKSARRQISGWIWGPNSAEQLTKMRDWRINRTKATLRDHTGESKRCYCASLRLEPVQDIASWKSGRQTYRYDAEFVEV